MFDLTNVPTETRTLIEASPKYLDLFSRWPETLLGIASDAKTIKGEKYGFRTAILYLSPSDSSGSNLCPMAQVANCAEACLNSAGRGAMQNVQIARLRKTLAYLQFPERFIAQLSKEIGRAKAKAKRDGVTLLVRLNGTSDIRWEQVAPSLFTDHSDVQMYDYTKIPNRKNVPSNYDLTFSYSGVKAYAPHVVKAQQKLMRIAVVFSHQERIPSTFQGLQCVDGDDSDIRHLDAQGVVVALYAKGKAKHDTSGFVVQV